MKRLLWVDQMRGFCMIAVLWFHTEMYYAGTDVTPYALYVGDVLAGFFFLTGYLFHGGGEFDFSKKIKSIFRWLIIPYFFFTALIAIPKAFVHNSYNGILPLAVNILSGRASWFVAALIVSELLFTFAMKITRCRLVAMGVLALLALVASYFVGNEHAHTLFYYKQNLWFVNEALLGFFLIFVGFLYHRYENTIEKIPQWIFLPALIAGLIIIKYFMLRPGEIFVFGSLNVSDYPLFVVDLIVAVLLLVTVFKKIPQTLPLEWTGSHTLVYYFFCGGVPLIVSRLLIAAGFPYRGYLSMVVAYPLVYLATTAIAWFFYRYTGIVRRPK